MYIIISGTVQEWIKNHCTDVQLFIPAEIITHFIKLCSLTKQLNPATRDCTGRGYRATQNPCILFTVIHLIEEEAVSEEENSGDEEDLVALHKEADTENAKAGKRKRKTQKEFTAR